MFSLQEKEVLVKEKADLQQLLSELGAQLQQTKALITEEGKAKEDLAAQLEVGKQNTWLCSPCTMYFACISACMLYAHMYYSMQEAKLSQEQLADQVVRTSEEKHKLTVELQAATKVCA